MPVQITLPIESGFTLNTYSALGYGKLYHNAKGDLVYKPDTYSANDEALIIFKGNGWSIPVYVTKISNPQTHAELFPLRPAPKGTKVELT